MRVLAFDYQTGMITTARSAECNKTNVLVGNVLTEQGGREVVKKGFQMILLGGGHRCRAVLQLNQKGNANRLSVYCVSF